MLEPGQPFPENADTLRALLEKLRKRLDARELTNSQYAYQSARLIKEIERMERKKRRTALT